MTLRIPTIVLLSVLVTGTAYAQWFFIKQGQQTNGSNCAGKLVGGYCWYGGQSDPPPAANCTTTCAGHGGYNAATLTYAGSSGSNANCAAVIVAVTGTPTICSSTGGVATSTDAGIGCFVDDANGFCRRDTTATTEAATPSSGFSVFARMCACNN